MQQSLPHKTGFASKIRRPQLHISVTLSSITKEQLAGDFIFLKEGQVPDQAGMSVQKMERYFILKSV